MIQNPTLSEKTNDTAIWCEKYRPQTVNDCILPDRLKKTFSDFVTYGNFPNLLLSGSAGTGKTSIARALCNDLDMSYIFINASDERNIDVVRTRIKDFASTTSFDGSRKCIILDESDHLSTIAQAALRAAIEEFSMVRFILTCNYKNKLIDPLKSRTTTIEFSIKQNELNVMKIKFLKRVFEILSLEHVQYDEKSVGAIVKEYFPDNRRILNELQRYSIGGTIDSGILASLEKFKVDTLMISIKNKHFGECRQWIEDNSAAEPSGLFRMIYDGLYNIVKPECVPILAIMTADYQYKSAFAVDQNINTMAYIASIMTEIEFK